MAIERLEFARRPHPVRARGGATARWRGRASGSPCARMGGGARRRRSAARPTPIRLSGAPRACVVRALRRARRGRRWEEWPSGAGRRSRDGGIVLSPVVEDRGGLQGRASGRPTCPFARRSRCGLTSPRPCRGFSCAMRWARGRCAASTSPCTPAPERTDRRALPLSATQQAPAPPHERPSVHRFRPRPEVRLAPR